MFVYPGLGYSWHPISTQSKGQWLFMASNFYSKQRPVVQQKHKSRTARPPHPVYGPGDCLPSVNSATVSEFDEEFPVSPCIIKFFLNSRP